MTETIRIKLDRKNPPKKQLDRLTTWHCSFSLCTKYELLCRTNMLILIRRSEGFCHNMRHLLLRLCEVQKWVWRTSRMTTDCFTITSSEMFLKKCFLYWNWKWPHSFMTTNESFDIFIFNHANGLYCKFLGNLQSFPNKVKPKHVKTHACLKHLQKKAPSCHDILTCQDRKQTGIFSTSKSVTLTVSSSFYDNIHEVFFPCDIPVHLLF